MTVNDFQIKIKINQQYAELVRPLSTKEYDQLKESIKKNKGLHLPIIINQDNTILDGHHRYQICKELDIEPKYEVKTFEDLLEEKEFVIDINDKRRQLNDFSKAELAYELEKIESEKARLRQIQLAGTRPNSNTLGSIDHKVQNKEDKGTTREIVAKKLGVSPGTYQRAKVIIENGTEDQKQRLREGKSTINKEYEKIRKDQKRAEFKSIQMKANNSFPDHCMILPEDFREIADKAIPDSSIDLIVTDPPYADTEENLSLYNELAILAQDKLKPGGSLVFLVGHINLNKIIRIFDNYQNDLKYWWTFAVKHSSNHSKIHARHIFAQWKPMLWYVKGNASNELTISNTIGDFIDSNRPAKLMHEWEQSTTEAEYVIKNLTIENQTVLDPMMGSGTNGVAVLRLKRRFVGIEKDENNFKIAEARLKKPSI